MAHCQAAYVQVMQSGWQAYSSALVGGLLLKGSILIGAKMRRLGIEPRPQPWKGWMLTTTPAAPNSITVEIIAFIKARSS